MPEAAITIVRQADRVRRENRLTDAHRDFVEAVALYRQAGAQRELVQALKRLGQIGKASFPLTRVVPTESAVSVVEAAPV